MNICDKCGQEVPDHNNLLHFMVAMVDVEMRHEVFVQNRNAARHLLPVHGPGGDLVCEGSPSRAQYLEGQPRDSRTEYPYDDRDENYSRQAWALMQERYPHPNSPLRIADRPLEKTFP